ncbi:hypothetical protein L596_004680 [Steinernema carpocapsae]|uniref:Uncharacterized protein n=1 Tax=Steinernema carpocapsae TaxID=34508 RepID=A0A4U8UY62_STECR|nr:hypothetical protein L596_004680 [Steinernema carpocapsae]
MEALEDGEVPQLPTAPAPPPKPKLTIRRASRGLPAPQTLSLSVGENRAASLGAVPVPVLVPPGGRVGVCEDRRWRRPEEAGGEAGPHQGGLPADPRRIKAVMSDVLEATQVRFEAFRIVLEVIQPYGGETLQNHESFEPERRLDLAEMGQDVRYFVLIIYFDDHRIRSGCPADWRGTIVRHRLWARRDSSHGPRSRRHWPLFVRRRANSIQ